MEIINPSGKKTFKVETDFCGRPLTLEVNRVGFRTTSSVLVTYGDTVVLGSVVVGQKPVMQDFFPLSIDYEEKYYASGKISSSKFIKREGKPSDNAVLIGRLIDRPIRPLFPKGYRQEIQVVATVLSMDPNFRPDVIAMIAASSALMNAGVPFDGPIAGLRIGRVNGEYKAFLTPEEREASDLDLVVAGKDSGITMVEAGANEVPEDVILGIRPEDITPVEKGKDNVYDITVNVAELLGHEYYVHSDFGGADLIAKFPAAQPIQIGDQLKIGFKVEKVHFFDPESTNAII